MTQAVSIFWFRRDLRVEDNHGLYAALKGQYPVLGLFIFDKNILAELPALDARVTFIYNEVMRLRSIFREHGGELVIRYGYPKEVFQSLLEEYNIQRVYTNKDYEPYATQRDQTITRLLAQKDIKLCLYKDHVIYEGSEVTKDDGNPYTVFTPYKKKWMQRWELEPPSTYPSSDLLDQLAETAHTPAMSLAEMGFESSDLLIPPRQITQSIIKNYHKTRDIPADKNGTSRLGIHFRFGTISIRAKARKAYSLNETYLSELIWRDFYSQILFHYPHVVDGAFREKYDQIPWRNDQADFDRWCKGTTGYPLVDAGMRQLVQSGYMHNRVRMLTASFLTKHLLIDWRWGEAFFAKHLLDYDLASNNGGWQWAAGCGTDAAPYFRIFNPTLQLKKFDPDFEYVKRWISEWNTDRYPMPMVDHKEARQRCLDTYKSVLKPE